MIGSIYYKGSTNYPLDINKSMYYFKLSANQNHHLALNQLGHVYLHGEYVEKDVNKAIQYYERSANLDDGEAQLELGNLFEKNCYWILMLARQSNLIFWYFFFDLWIYKHMLK